MIAKRRSRAEWRNVGAQRNRSFLATGYVWLLWFAVMLAAAALVYTLIALSDTRVDNRLIRQLESRRDVAVPERSDPEVSFARLRFLTTVGRLDDALPLVETIAAAAVRVDGTPGSQHEVSVAVRALYNMGNARLRHAIELLGTSKSEEAPSSVRLAKEHYVRALRLAPGFWNARYNLDIASRLVRDLPEGELTEEDEEPETPKRLWTDLPGIPKGLP